MFQFSGVIAQGRSRDVGFITASVTPKEESQKHTNWKLGLSNLFRRAPIHISHRVSPLRSHLWKPPFVELIWILISKFAQLIGATPEFTFVTSTSWPSFRAATMISTGFCFPFRQGCPLHEIGRKQAIVLKCICSMLLCCYVATAYIQVQEIMPSICTVPRVPII
jgi:hypothetical protein